LRVDSLGLRVEEFARRGSTEELMQNAFRVYASELRV